MPGKTTTKLKPGRAYAQTLLTIILSCMQMAETGYNHVRAIA